MRTLLWILIICVSVFSDGAMANDEGLDFQLQVAGNNRPEIQKALDLIPPEQKEGMRFLVRHMQEQDLQTLTSEFLIENTRLAYQARERAAWKIPDDLFLNYVLPYSNVDEERDPWRKELFDLSAPIVVDCTTTTCATQNLNQLLFQKVGVQYSTKRKKANQSPKESIDQGLASCTGLSILLVDACRSVGVPARLVGIPSW
ncbi:MAG: transglutaminase-like domain-containing protein, partial [Planctomycetota bacterium]